jgi:hypothetical protein
LPVSSSLREERKGRYVAIASLSQERLPIIGGGEVIQSNLIQFKYKINYPIKQSKEEAVLGEGKGSECRFCCKKSTQSCRMEICPILLFSAALSQ